MLSEAIAYLQKHTGMERVVFYLYDFSTFSIFREKLSELSGGAI
jgi:hypothetical protein